MGTGSRVLPGIRAADGILSLLLLGASLHANGQLNGSASKNGHKEAGSLRSQDGSEDGPVKKR